MKINKTFLSAVSVMAIMVTTPAIAETSVETNTNMKAEVETSSESTGSFSKDAKKAWKDIKKDTSKAAESVSDTAKDVYQGTKSALTGDDDSHATMTKANVDSRITAEGMIGEPVYNANGDRVAKVHDIILDADGNAEMVILADGDFTGMGKLVAFDYNTITTRAKDGDMIVPFNESMIDKATSFSYDRAQASSDVEVMTTSGYSVSELLDGQIVNPQGDSLANVDNIVFRNGKADQVIVSFGKVLGLGGETAAISYHDAELSRENGSIDFKLSANESMEFKQFQETL